MRPDDESAQSEIDDLLKPYLRNADKQLVVDTGPVNTRRAVVSNTYGSLLGLVGYVPIDISLKPEGATLEPGEPLDFTVTITNRSTIDIPLSLTCSTLWGWYLDGHPEATTSDHYNSPPRRVKVRGSQSYTFERRWSGYIHDGGDIRPPDSGEHTFEARIHTEDRSDQGLFDTIELQILDA
ncbi:uncharacterized protein HVO_A0430A (plasmid) [Haloferax volcanii DS2]|uniref:DUF7974 domain-containing protein n=1 Tax=Haloferax volcanii (strain ATCC 29605 / DSM 3757 / JCM 8879 / NBRC 14742 / NCIMB 2012 / VKM B-1768 / DS2) TaxID=309800 RepID=D4GR96_HALVD|nr:uncharacterized protein HVO_A0430A [Haloferax volcanii DS2]